MPGLFSWDKLKKVASATYHGLNTFDGGQGWTSQAPASQTPQTSVTDRIRNAKYGVLANNPQAQESLIQASQPARFYPVSATLESVIQSPYQLGRGAAKFGVDTTKAIANPIINTAQLPYSANRLAVANITRNQVAANNARQALVQDARNNIFTPVKHFGNDLATTIYAPTATRNIERSSQNLGNTLANAYGNTPQARIFGDTVASSTKNQMLNEYLNGVGLDQNSSKAKLGFKVGADIANAASPLLYAYGGGAGAAAKGIVPALKTAGKFGLANAAVTTAGLASEGDSNPMDYLKQGGVSFALGAGIPLAGKAASVAAKELKPTAKAVSANTVKAYKATDGFNAAKVADKATEARLFAESRLSATHQKIGIAQNEGRSTATLQKQLNRDRARYLAAKAAEKAAIANRDANIGMSIKPVNPSESNPKYNPKAKPTSPEQPLSNRTTSLDNSINPESQVFKSPQGKAMSVEPLEALKTEARVFRSEAPNRYGIGQAELGSGLYTGSKEVAGRTADGKVVTDGLFEYKVNPKANILDSSSDVFRSIDAKASNDPVLKSLDGRAWQQRKADLVAEMVKAQGYDGVRRGTNQVVAMSENALIPVTKNAPMYKATPSLTRKEQLPIDKQDTKGGGLNRTSERTIPDGYLPAPEPPKVRRSQLSGKALSIPDKQLKASEQIKSNTVNEYADVLKSIDDSMSGGDMVRSFDGVYEGLKRTSSHSDFYRNYFAETGRKPSRAAWREEAQRQLDSGKAMSEFQDMYNKSNDPEFTSLAASAPGKELNGYEKNKRSAQAISKEVRAFRDTLTPVKQRSGETAVPVSKVSQKGDTLTKTNVNPNVKAGEKRFSVDSDGNLIEDRKGAYRIFTNEDGKIDHIRIGNKLYNEKDYGDLSDVNGYGSTVATMRRNVERAFGKKTSDKLSRFLVDHQQQAATQMIERNLAIKEGMKGVANDLGINFAGNFRKAKKISAAIQDYGEGARSKQSLVEEFGKDQAAKIVKADTWFRNQYNTLLDEMNSTLEQYGYDPVPKRKNYYTHFQDEKLWKSFGLKMQEISKEFGSPTMQDANPGAARGKISNQLAGQSEYMTPNKRFNPFALRRQGEAHTSDAFQAFERYLNPTLSNIYMTPSISRARVIARGIADAADLEGKDANKTIIQLREWANHLAGKSNRLGDRQLADTMSGGKYLRMANWVQKKAGQNTIVGNLATAALQPVVLAQTAGKFGYKNFLLGTLQAASPQSRKLLSQSSFLKRRYADTSLVTAGKMDKARDIANTPLYVVEKTAAEATWLSAHNDALSKGLRGSEAIRYADINAEKTLSGRSIGERPEAFRGKALGPVTMYQLEVNNFWQQFGKEMTKGQAAKTLAAMYLFNVGLQSLTGRQVGFNPIDDAIKSYQDFQKEDKPLGEKIKSTAQRFAGDVVDNAPFVAPLANAGIGDKNLRKLLGNTSNTGRFGVASPISSLLTTTDVGLPVNVPLNAILPFGGSQAKKTIDAYRSLNQGAVTDKNNKTLVNVPQTAGNYIKGLAFGKNAIPEVNKYYQNIGAKKYDQVAVPNQTDSRAKNQGINTTGQGINPFKGADGTYDKKALTTAFGSEFANLTADQRKDWAKQSPKNQAIFNQFNAFERSITTPDIPANVSKASGDILTQYSRLTDQARDKKINSEPDYEFKLKVAQYEKDKPTLTKKQQFDRENALYKLQVGSKYPKEVRDLYSMSKASIEAYIAKNGISDEQYKQLLALDQAEVAAGLRKYSKFGGGSSGRKGKSARTAQKESLSTVLAALKSSNAALKPPTPPKSPNIKVSRQSPTTYKKANLRKYVVKQRKATA